MSDTELFTALAKAQLKFKSVSKNGRANYGKFADLQDLFDATKTALNEHGLCVLQGVDENGCMVTNLVHASGGSVCFKTRMIIEKNTAQGFGIASTYYRRYGYQAILGIVGEDDTDGEINPVKPIAKPEPTFTKSFAASQSQEYVVPFGAFKDRVLTSLNLEDIQSTIKWLQSAKNLDVKGSELLNRCNAHLNNLTKGK